MDVPYQAALEPAVELFNDYFYGGMAGIVFQEIREARALAYSVGALYFNGRDTNETTTSWSAAWALKPTRRPKRLRPSPACSTTFPPRPERFAAAPAFSAQQITALSASAFRSVLGAVRGWERKGLTGDPRAWRFEQLQASDLDEVLEFYRQHVQGRPKLISITRRQEQNGSRGSSSTGRDRRTKPRRALCLLMPVDKKRSAV